MMCLNSRTVLSVQVLFLVFVLVDGSNGTDGPDLPPHPPLPHPLPHTSHEPLEFEKRIGSSVNGSSSTYYFSSISSPDFPSEFATPFTKFYVINISSLTGLQSPVLNIYLTELFTGEKSFNLYDGLGEPRNMSLTVKQIPILLAEDEVAELQVYIPNMTNQFRTKVHFHDIYGYNITLEVVEGDGREGEGVGESSNSCSIRNCSFAGRCKATPGEQRLEFRCECLDGYSGPYCQYGPECDPRRNINFCQNGGTCRMLGYAGGSCVCPDGFGGAKCQLRKRARNFVTTNRDCEISNGFSVQDRPCSLCNTFPDKPPSWYRFLLISESSRGKFSSSLGTVQGSWNVSEHLAKYFEQYVLGMEWVEGNRTIVEVFGKTSTEFNRNSSSGHRRLRNANAVPFPLGPGVTLRRADSISTLPVGQDAILQPRVWMNKEKEKPLLEGQEFILTCRSQRPTPSSLISFRWFKDHVLIREEYTLKRRRISHIYPQPGGGDEIWSFLMIDSVSPFDMGVFTCQVTDLTSNVQECAEYSMLVVVPPQIEVMPMSVTMIKNESRILMCSDSLEELDSQSHDHLEISWYKDGELLLSLGSSHFSTESIYPQGQLLRVKDASTSASFTCRASNKGGTRERSVRVEVLPPTPSPREYCPRSCEVVEGTGAFRMTWGLTAIFSTALIPCPHNFSGYAQRWCGIGEKGLGKWGPSDFSRCSHQQLGRFNFTLRSMEKGYNVRSEGLRSLHSQLNAYLEGRRGSGSVGESLLFGEGDKFIGMLEDTFAYVRVLNRSISPRLVKEETILGLVSVVDNFMNFRNSCAHHTTIDRLLRHVFTFLKEFRVDSYSSSHIFIESVLLPRFTSNETSTSVIINGTSTQLVFDCDAFIPREDDKVNPDLELDLSDDEEESQRFLILTEISDVSELNDNVSILSSVVRVDISPGLEESKSCVKEDAVFQLILHQPLSLGVSMENMNSSRRSNKTCGRLDGLSWTLDVCTINTTVEGEIVCICKVSLLQGTEAYALLAVEETPIPPLKEDKKIPPPPEWIAASGVVVCLVLCSRTLVVGLFRRVFQPHFLLVSSGIVVTSLCLLYIVLMRYCHEVWLIYMSLTLGVQSVRIWRMVWVGNLGELVPWLGHVSPWIVLSAITFTQVGPLLAVVLLDSSSGSWSTISSSDGGVAQEEIDQQSAIFITFAALVALSVVSIVLLYYKTHLGFHRKTATAGTNANNLLHGDQQILNETLFQTLVHTVQILCLVLYISLGPIIFFHYLFASTTTILGLSWNVPRTAQKRRNNPTGVVEEAQPLPSRYMNGTGNRATPNSTATLSLPTPKPPFYAFRPQNCGRRLSISSSRDMHKPTLSQHKLELKPLAFPNGSTPTAEPLNGLRKPEPRPQHSLEEEEEDPVTFDTNLSVSTIKSQVCLGKQRPGILQCPASSSGMGYLRPYLGALPIRGECHLLMDDYVLPTTQLQHPNCDKLCGE